MDRQNGFTNGMKDECKVETYVGSRSSISMCHQGYSEVDKGVPLQTTFPDLSPIRISPPNKHSPGLSPIMSCGQQNKSFGSSFSSPKQGKKSLFHYHKQSLICYWVKISHMFLQFCFTSLQFQIHHLVITVFWTGRRRWRWKVRYWTPRRAARNPLFSNEWSGSTARGLWRKASSSNASPSWALVRVNPVKIMSRKTTRISKSRWKICLFFDICARNFEHSCP